MFYKHIIINNKNEEVLYLYLINTQEFANDLNNENSKENIIDKINNYIRNANIDFNGKKVYLVINDIIISSIDLKNNKYDNYTISENNAKLINLEKSTGIIKKMKLEDYVFGVVSNEMPGIFNIEALKAQAVLARTYAMKRIKNNLPIRDQNSIQIYRDIKYLRDIWKDKFKKYYSKIKKAVKDTEDEVLKYKENYIETYYHTCNNGKTEESENVLKLAYPYLTSVPSEWDLNNNWHVGIREVSNEYLEKLLNTPINKNTKVTILSKTKGNCVKYIKFNNKVFDGLILSRRLALNSNDFSVQIKRNSTIFTTKGHGSGLGLSKYGAEGMANSGYNYKQILNHYYQNTYIEKEKTY